MNNYKELEMKEINLKEMLINQTKHFMMFNNYWLMLKIRMHNQKKKLKN